MTEDISPRIYDTLSPSQNRILAEIFSQNPHLSDDDKLLLAHIYCTLSDILNAIPQVMSTQNELLTNISHRTFVGGSAINDSVSPLLEILNSLKSARRRQSATGPLVSSLK